MGPDLIHKEIVRRLSGRLDPEVFERCVSDVLRNIWPGLVPVPGGSDSGMDGAVADGEGPAFPLVATTDQHPIRNLTRSLKSYVKDGGKRRKVILATSQVLNQRRRRSLEEKAERLGFVLVQICDGTSIADLLYRDPRWCKELLGLRAYPITPAARSVMYAQARCSIAV